MIKNLHQLNLILIHAIYRGKMRRKCNLNFSQNSQFPSEIHSYKPPLPIQYLGFPFHILHSERWACSGCYSIFFSLCPSSALMAVYRLGNISTQMKLWKMISMQFVQVRSQNRSVPSRGGRYGKNISTFHDFITILFVMLVLLFCLSSMARLISLL